MKSSHFNSPCWLLAGAVLLACFGLGGMARSETTKVVEVELQSGRLFQAFVDPRTDEVNLWLRFSRSTYGELTILRPVRWDAVRAIRRDGEEILPADYRRVTEDLKNKTPRTVFPASAKSASSTAPILCSSIETCLPPPLVIPAETVPLVVTHFDIDAMLANWDSDVEVDGIELHIFPRTAEGVVVPVSGSIEAKLLARVANPADPGQVFPQIGRWVEAIGPERFGPGGAVFRLSFQAVHPDFDLHLGPQGVLHVRLVAPGHGTFETSTADLRIRPYSSMRDRLQHRENRRFFSVERTGR
jgi:hypothetical protein